MKIRILIAKVFVMACLVAVASTVFTSCGKEKEDNKTENNGNNNNQQQELGPLEQTVWLADTSISTPQNLPIPVQLPDITVDFTSELHFTTAADGFLTLTVDLLGSTDTAAYTYDFSNNRGFITLVDNPNVTAPYTKSGDKITVSILREFIDDTSSVLDMVFAYFQAQGGLKFNYYKQ